MDHHDFSATTADTAAELETGKLSQAAIDFAKTRGISARTLERLGAGSGTAYFPRRLERRSEAVFFPYRADGQLANWKACAFPEKDFIGMKGGKLCFCNIDLLLAASPGDVWFVEGEWDLAAMVEAGIPVERVTTVPNGGREHKEGEDKPQGPNGYGYVEEALRRGLGKHKRLIWCGDADSTGYALRQDMAQLLGPAKFWFMEWPEGIKDANDMLRKDGPQALHELVTEGILPWPVKGLYALSDLPELAPIQTWAVPQLFAWHNKIKFAPGTMSVVTGHPGHGKTALMAQVWHDIADRNNLVVAAATFETRAKPHYRRMLRTLQSGRLEKDMTAQDTALADNWINEHYRFMVHPDQRPDLTWVLNMAEVAVVRHRAQVVQIDPWNRLESQRDRFETETEYIGRCLTSLYVFAQDMGCHVQIIAHPAKMDGPRKNKPPELDDIAGSKHWDNRVDQGLVIHRPKMFVGAERRTDAMVFHKKTRFEELGHPCRLGLNYNTDCGRFEDALFGGDEK